METALELHNIQGTVLRNRPMPYYGSYVVFSIDNAQSAIVLVERLIPHITSAASWNAPAENAWINVVFTYEGLKRLGLPEHILQGFPIEFRQGMAARKHFLGDLGENDPEHWDLPHGGNGFHIGLFVMAGSPSLREEKIAIGHKAITELKGVKTISRLDVGIPPTLREHFGYTDGLSRPFIEGEGGCPMPGQGKPFKAGEFVLGYVDETGTLAVGPGPEEFWKNSTYLSIRKMYQKVHLFREFLRRQGETAEEQERVAAKMMGRWRSGCPLSLSPEKDNFELARDPMRNNDFAYLADDPDGRKTPLGCHIRRVNPRDSLDNTSTNSRMHRLLRRGAAYGPLLPDDAACDDDKDRGIVVAFVNANPGRQFEFVQSQWVNDGDFISQGRKTDPIIGRRDLADDYTYPERPVRKHITGLQDFAITRGGEHVFLPGLNGLRWMVSFLKNI